MVLPALRDFSAGIAEMPAEWGFHEPLRSLYITNAHFWSAKLTKVSGRLCNYSHFREIVFGDCFDSH